MSLTTSQKRKCQHQKNSCRQCSLVKMVAYKTDNRKDVWYSFIKEENKIQSKDGIATSMLKRYLKYSNPGLLKIIQFYDNQNPQADAFAVYEQSDSKN